MLVAGPQEVWIALGVGFDVGREREGEAGRGMLINGCAPLDPWTSAKLCKEAVLFVITVYIIVH